MTQQIATEAPKERKHKIVNKVEWSWENRAEIPKRQKNKVQIYAILIDDQVIGVGQSRNMRDRIPNGYRWKVAIAESDGSTIIKYMQERAAANGNYLKFSAMFLEEVDDDDKLVAEGKWIAAFRADNQPIQNKTGPIKEKPEPQPRLPRLPRLKISGKAGGWYINASDYGRGKKVRCKIPVDGSYWECDLDALVDAINASLRAKGKPEIGKPGPSEKSYSASSGLREPHLWVRVEDKTIQLIEG